MIPKLFPALVLLLFLSVQFFASATFTPPVLSYIQSGPGTNDAVFLPDGRIAVSGNFSVANGKFRSCLAILNADGTLDQSFSPGIVSSSLEEPVIRKVLLQADGKFVIGGNFTSINGVLKNHLARLNADGSLDTTFNTGTGPNSKLTNLALQPDGKVIIAGSFTQVNGINRKGLARINTDGSFDTSFLGEITLSFNAEPVSTILFQSDGKIVISGNFNSINSTTRPSIARLNSDGSLDSSFAISPSPTNFFWISGTHERADGKLYITGGFELKVSNVTICKNVCLLNSDGTLDQSYTISFGVNMTVNSSFLQPDGKLLIHGGFSTINGSPVNGTVRLNENASIDGTFNPAFSVSESGFINFRPHPAGGFLLTGNYRSINGAVAENLSRIDANGFLNETFSPNFGGNAVQNTASAVQADGKVIIAGNFHRVNGVVRDGLARLNPDGSLDSTFNASIATGSWVQQIVLQPDAKILIGGAFVQVSGQARTYIARLNADGTLDASFNPVLTHTSSGPGTVETLYVQSDGKILIGGAFESVNGTACYRMARLNSNGSFDAGFSNPLSTTYNNYSNVFLELPSGKILLGGDFRMPGSTTTLSLVGLNSDGTVDATFTPPTESTNIPYFVKSLTRQPDGKILVGGSFGFLPGQPMLTRLNANGTKDVSFNQPSIGVGFTSDDIRKIIVGADGRIVIAGSFGRVNSVPASSVARLTSTGELDRTVIQSRFDGLAKLSGFSPAADGGFIASGVFSRFRNETVSGVVQVTVGGAVPFDFDGDGKTDIGIFRPSGGEWWINRSGNGQTFALQFGASTDKIGPADFTGDGKSDIAFFRPSSGEWYVLRSEDFSFFALPFGTNGDVPVPADYDADGKADFAVFRPSSSTWFVSQSSGAPTRIFQFGITGDSPVVSDYDADGKADVGIFRKAAGGAEWWVQRSTAGLLAMQFGGNSDKPVQGDYTGDGKADVAIWRPSTGEWLIVRSEDFSFYGFPFGTSGDVVAPGDYDGDGKFDVTVFRPSSATWFISRTTAGTQIVQFGSNGDRPLPNAFVP